MTNNTILLRVLDFNAEEIKTFIKTAIRLFHDENQINLEEWSIVSLVPALLAITHEKAPQKLKGQWREKLQLASIALKNESENLILDNLNITSVIQDKNKRDTFILALFLVVSADRKIESREIDFIINNISKPWGYTVQEIIALIRSEQKELDQSQDIIKVIEHFK